MDSCSQTEGGRVLIGGGGGGYHVNFEIRQCHMSPSLMSHVKKLMLHVNFFK